MENTDEILFGKDGGALEWFIAQGDAHVGPFAAMDIYKKLCSGELSWAIPVWKKGMKEWMRAFEAEPFKALMPKISTKAMPTPDAGAKPTVKAAAKAPKKTVSPPKPPTAAEIKPVAKREWYLYYSETQYGPFSVGEVEHLLKIGKIHARVFGWKEGMEGWNRLEAISEFKKLAAEAQKAYLARKSALTPVEVEKVELDNNKRKAPRKPIVAKVFVANQRVLASGVCRDISIGGMQVLTDSVPGKVGDVIQMNVSPSSEGKGGASLPPFVAKGVIVRVLEDGRGFSFRFEGLDEAAKKAIQKYVED